MPALSAEYTADGLLCLGLPVETGTTFQFVGDTQALRDAEVVRKAMSTLTATQVTIAQAIIDQWRAIRYDTDTIKAEGLDSNPFRARQHLKLLLRNAIGWNPPSGGGITIQRG